MDNTKIFYRCKRIKLYFYLKERGFTPLLTTSDRYKPNYNNWLFQDTPKLRETIDEYYKERK